MMPVLTAEKLITETREKAARMQAGKPEVWISLAAVARLIELPRQCAEMLAGDLVLLGARMRYRKMPHGNTTKWFEQASVLNAWRKIKRAQRP